jgi:hypothetical protein
MNATPGGKNRAPGGRRESVSLAGSVGPPHGRRLSAVHRQARLDACPGRQGVWPTESHRYAKPKVVNDGPQMFCSSSCELYGQTLVLYDCDGKVYDSQPLSGRWRCSTQ